MITFIKLHAKYNLIGGKCKNKGKGKAFAGKFSFLCVDMKIKPASNDYLVLSVSCLLENTLYIICDCIFHFTSICVPPFSGGVLLIDLCVKKVGSRLLQQTEAH